MTIIADADPMPREILWPGDTHPRFFSQRFAVTPGSATAACLSLDDPRCVVSAADLQFAWLEIDALTAAVARARTRSRHLYSGSAEADLRANGQAFGLLHFVCHNRFAASAPSASVIRIVSEEFTPTMLKSSPSALPVTPSDPS
jgi:hypothetical protein